MEMQQALVNARIDEIREAASESRAARTRSVRERPTRAAKARVALGLWFVSVGMGLVHGAGPLAQRR